MGPIQKLEGILDGVLRKNAPYQLPENARKSIAGAMWVLALVFGIVQIWLAYSFWHAAHRLDSLVDYANSLSEIYGTATPYISHLGFFFYLSLVVLLVDGVLLLAAFPKLKLFSKSGWNLLFYGVLVNAAYGLIRVFSEYSGSFSNFLWAAVGSLVGAYFLFQVRPYFDGTKHVAQEHANIRPRTPVAAHKDEPKADGEAK